MLKNPRRLFWILFILTIGWMLLMRPYSPSNIIQFELAKTTGVAQQIMDLWGAEGIAKAKMSIYLDYVFLLLYSITISIGCKLSFSFSSSEVIRKISIWLSRIVLFAGACDAFENACMLLTLSNPTEWSALLAFYFAVIKFGIIGIAILWILISAVTGLIKKKVPVT